ncbi:RNA-directed DNA polymerase [Tetragenococcus halophilus]|uniref:RNA-directed DNA polymerase n=1 Tax=Tetragenococcus halophilus TaxID=51669 RepID=UPI00295EE73E|nr:RNA-directed DNA polymerase [Tetragenococcus halophilus]
MNYFSFNRYKYLKGLIESAQFRRTQYKFDYFRKLDIQNFFPSIYTHSLSWALFGSKVLGKSYSGVKEAFPNKTDRIMQEINFMETNGIVVGPEFSRMVAELLLVDIDSKLLIYMENNGIYHHSDYKIYRFVDDYYIFANNSYHISLIENELQRLLEGYNLTLNTHKAELQQKPFKISNKAISDLRNILSEFEHSKLVSVFRNLEKHVKVNINNNDITLSHVSLKSFKGTRQQWNDLFIQIELLIDEYPNEKNKIVNYFLQSIRSQINFDGEHINIFKDILEIVSNIYTLNITTKSTNYLLTINLKLQQALSKFENKQAKLEDRELTDVILKKQREANDLKENIYQHLFRVMKNNLTRMNYMYDLLVFMKSLDKKLPASFLSTIIEKFKNSYFVLCSVGYYILDDSLQSVDKRYITVRKKLTKVVTDYINNYKSWGIKNQKIILEADFFYFINDFSKYPGFETSVKKGLNALLTKEIGKVVSQNSLQKQLWKNLTDRSYFQWEGTYENFKRKIIKKNSNIGKNIRVGDY